MKQYNRALDFMSLSAVQLQAGNTTRAAKLLAKAVKEPSFARAIQIIEASNAQAYRAHSRARTVRAAEEEALDSLVTDLDDDEGDDMEEVEVEETASTQFARVLRSMR